MLQLINDLPQHVVGVHAFKDVAEMEYEGILIQLLDEQLKKCSKLNFILVLETDIKNFAPGMWCGNVRIGFRYFFKWCKVAIVSDQKGVLGYNDLFKYVIPGKFRTFPLDDIDKAIRWVSQK
jgi:hypothetical protein